MSKFVNIAYSELRILQSLCPIIPHHVVRRYNALFRLLLELRRTQASLHHSWALLMQHRNRWEELRQVWELRTQMGFLIDNLQYYVQVCVSGTCQTTGQPDRCWSFIPSLENSVWPLYSLVPRFSSNI